MINYGSRSDVAGQAFSGRVTEQALSGTFDAREVFMTRAIAVALKFPSYPRSNSRLLS